MTSPIGKPIANLSKLSGKQWGIVIVGGVGAGYLISKRLKSVKATAPTTQYVADTSAAANTSAAITGVGLPPYMNATTSAANTAASLAPAITTNEQWGIAALANAVRKGANPTTSDAAIRKFLSGLTVTGQDKAIVDQAISDIGPLPNALPAAQDAPVIAGNSGQSYGLFRTKGDGRVYELYSDHTKRYVGRAEYIFRGMPPFTDLDSLADYATIGNDPPPSPISGNVTPVQNAPVNAPPQLTSPAPVVNPPAPAPYTARRYTVVAGDNLFNIAAKEYGNSNKWPDIYNANRNIISTPSLIYAGQVLVIP